MTASQAPDLGIVGLAPPRTIDVLAGGETLHISPAPISALGSMLREGKNIFAALNDGESLAEIFVDHTTALIDICAYGTGKTTAQISALPGDEFMVLLGAILEVNADFFTRRLRPAMESMIDRMTAAIGPQNSDHASTD